MFQDALANACSPISIKIDIDPAAMQPGMKMPGACPTGSIVDRDHGYFGKQDPMAKMIQDLMCKAGICPPEACKQDAPEQDPEDGGDNPFAKPKGARK